MLRRPRIAPACSPLALVGTFASGSVVAGDRPAAEPQVPDPYFPEDGNVGYDVLHYDIRDRYRFDDKHLAGTTTVRLVPLEELTSFSLDLLLTSTRWRSTARRRRSTSPTSTSWSSRRPSRWPQATPVDVMVSTTASRRRSPAAASANWLANRHEVVTMNEPHMAAWWFPSNDHPSDKATFDIRVTTAKSREVDQQRRARRADGPRPDGDHPLADDRPDGDVPRILRGR